MPLPPVQELRNKLDRLHTDATNALATLAVAETPAEELRAIYPALAAVLELLGPMRVTLAAVVEQLETRTDA